MVKQHSRWLQSPFQFKTNRCEFVFNHYVLLHIRQEHLCVSNMSRISNVLCNTLNQYDGWKTTKIWNRCFIVWMNKDSNFHKFFLLVKKKKKKKVKFFTNWEWNTLIYLNVNLDLDDCVGFWLHLYNLPILK